MPSHVPSAGRYLGGRPRIGDGLVDQVAVERARSGDPSVWLTVEERRAAVALMRHHGHSLRDIAERLGVADRTVCRHLAAARNNNPALIGAR